jgi:hypothetical protein
LARSSRIYRNVAAIWSAKFTNRGLRRDLAHAPRDLDEQLVNLALQIQLMEVCNEIWSAKFSNRGLRLDLAHVRVDLAL